MRFAKREILICAVLVSFSFAAGCKSPEEKLKQERKEAVKEVSKAEQKVDKVRQDEAKKIAESQGAKEVEDAKIKATEHIADANKDVQDEKVEATKEVTDAEQKAKKDEAPALP